MERLKLIRRPQRSFITRQISEATRELVKERKDSNILRTQLKILEEAITKISDIDQKILDQLLDDGASPESYDEEYEAIQEYVSKVIDVRTRIESVLAPPVLREAASVGQSSVSDTKKTLRLPKIEFKKFGGNPLDWLGFWTQFERIHQDPEIHDSDKFHYLRQATVEGSTPRDIIDSFPQSETNYEKAVQTLKDRYGRNKLLRQVYVRELLKLVISNATSHEHFNLSNTFLKLHTQLRALETLGVTVEMAAEFLFPLVESSLPDELLMAWQRSPFFGKEDIVADPEKTELYYLLQFIQREVDNEEQRLLARAGFGNTSENGDRKKKQEKTKSTSGSSTEKVATAASLLAGKTANCVFCDKGHRSSECVSAQRMSLQDKHKKIGEKRACFICLQHGHVAKNCRATVRCLHCHKRHYALLCRGLNEPESVTTQVDSPGSSQPAAAMCNQTCTSDVLLKTQIVKLVAPGGEERSLRVLYDSGNQRCYIRRAIAESLNLQKAGEEWIEKYLFGGSVTKPVLHKRYKILLKSCHGGNTQEVDVLDEPILCGRIPCVPKGTWTQEFAEYGIHFNDYENPPKDIDVVIGSDFYEELQTGRRVKSVTGLIAVETIFGWTLSGKLPGQPQRSSESLAMTVTALFVNSVVPAQLWSLETIGILDPVECKTKIEAETATKEHFLKTVTRKEDGRYAINLPWIEGASRVVNNRATAEKRLQSTSVKLCREGRFEDYGQIFKDWCAEGIIEEVTDTSRNQIESYYLPHRAVFKPESQTTPIRPVFDASCKDGRCPSLNECLEKGPNLIALIPEVLLRFRDGRFGVVSDIRKAFQMIEVKEEDRDVLRFLWWEDFKEKSYKVYRHKRVVFGVNCSPFLLAAVIEYHLKSIQDERKSVAEKLLKSMYVDNSVSAVNSLSEYESFRQISTGIMEEGKMELRQWEVSFALEDKCNHDGKNCVSHVLGLIWNKATDTLQCEVPNWEMQETISKRSILAHIQQIFDPIGFLSPAMIIPKQMMQQAWKLKSSWDEELPKEMADTFKTWMNQAKVLKEVSIPRDMTAVPDRESYQLHAFGDASQAAYAAVVFLRVQMKDQVTVRLVLAKSRVAPLKQVTMPRLELLACTIVARLVSTVKKTLSMDDIKTFLWSDSTTALAWIQRNDIWGTFVGNRVKEICSLTNVADWRHVPGVKNPADLPSRGCSPIKLLESQWWEGPDWLKESPEQWPNQESAVDEHLVKMEEKKCVIAQVATVNENSQPWYLFRSSSYFKNVRTMAWILRFIGQTRRLSNEKGCLTFEEVQLAEDTIFRLIQGEVFELKDESISNLRVYRDRNELIRIKTKLEYKDDAVDFKSPILLPNNHPWVDMMIRHEHLNNGHAGIQVLMAKIRERCWIIQSRKAIRRVVSKCVRCRRFSAKSFATTPTSLPKDRVNDACPFQVTGIDYAGPLMLKNGVKAWVVLFTCAVFRCIHLELVTSCDTEAFLWAFQRFVARRGKPDTVYSDNARQFIGANNLMSINWDNVLKDAQEKKIRWKFNPPTASWWGGWWERLIGLTKDLLRRILGQARVGYEELLTVLSQVEAILNDRPLTYVTEDVNDLRPLTPAMFLQGCLKTEVREIDVTGQDLRRRHRYQAKLKDEFRQRFRREYLSQLVQKGKQGNKENREFSIGDIVLVQNDLLKRIHWPMAKVIKLIPGKDGATRLYELKTANGVMLRPLQRLYPLEVSAQEKDVLKYRE